MSVLEELGALARERVEAARARRPEGDLAAALEGAPPTRDVLGRLRGAGRPALIAEFKRASPSAGAIAPAAAPAAVAQAYERAGAAMISVLTEPARFGGRLEDLAAARRASALPILQKDFVVDPYQLAEARLAGADCVLLIVALVGERLRELLARAHALGLTALVEAHTADELARAVGAGAALVGVNNRDLKTLQVDTAVSERLLPLVPPDRFALAESGLRSARAVARAVRAGADGVLVGEHLMRAADPAAAARDLRAAGRRFVKICGITRREDAELALGAGADAVGFVFAPSPRRVTADEARRLGDGLEIARVGVFAGTGAQEIARTAEAARLSGVQLHDREVDAGAVAALRAQGLDVLAAVQPGPGAVERARALARAGALVLADARTGPRPDGRGGTLDVEAAGEIGRAVRRMVVAGGLEPANVGAVVAALDPFGVDVSGGVESAPGVKDAARVRAFVAAARAPTGRTVAGTEASAG